MQEKKDKDPFNLLDEFSFWSDNNRILYRIIEFE